MDRLIGEKVEVEGSLRGLIVPHAGYECSGIVAGKVYALLKNRSYKRVVLVGPSHFVDFNGYSFGSFHAFETPLGRVEVDHLVLKGFPEEALRPFGTCHTCMNTPLRSSFPSFRGR